MNLAVCNANMSHHMTHDPIPLYSNKLVTNPVIVPGLLMTLLCLCLYKIIKLK